MLFCTPDTNNKKNKIKEQKKNGGGECETYFQVTICGKNKYCSDLPTNRAIAKVWLSFAVSTVVLICKNNII